MNRRIVTGSILLFTVVLFAIGDGIAGTKNWVGVTSASPGNWSVGSNWSPAGVPASGDNVYINNGSQQPLLINVTATCAAFYLTSSSFQGGSLASGVTLTVTGNAQFDASLASFTFADSTSKLRVGSFLVGGALIPGQGVVELIGPSYQNLGIATLNKLIINNASSVEIFGDCNVASLTLTTGAFICDGVLTVTNPITRTNGYVQGKLAHAFSGAGSYMFEVGDGSGYSPVSVNVYSGTGTFTVTAHDAIPDNINDANHVLSRYWNLAGDGLAYNFTLFYQAGDVNGNEAAYTAAVKYTTIWFPVGSTVSTGAHSEAVTGVTGTGDWTAGETVGLPIEIMSLDAVAAQNAVHLNWSTASETNCLGFYVERRAQGTVNFSTVSGLIAGAGTTLEHHDYTFTDGSAVGGTYFYRLKQVDTDGSTNYSGEIKVVVDGALGVNDVAPLTFGLRQNYPNPFNPVTTISFQLPEQGTVTLRVFNVAGVEVAVPVNGVRYSTGTHTSSFDATALASGAYYYSLSVAGTGRSYESVRKMMLVK